MAQKQSETRVHRMLMLLMPVKLVLLLAVVYLPIGNATDHELPNFMRRGAVALLESQSILESSALHTSGIKHIEHCHPDDNRLIVRVKNSAASGTDDTIAHRIDLVRIFLMTLSGTLIVCLVLSVNTWLRFKKSRIQLLGLGNGLQKLREGHTHHRLAVTEDRLFNSTYDEFNQTAKSLEQASIAQRHFLLTISHEMRSPLTRMRLHIESIDPLEVRDRLRIEVRILSNLIESLLEAESRLPAEKHFNPESIDLPEFLSELIRDYPISNGIALKIIGTARTVVLDKLRMSLLIKNLLSNAIKHSGDSTINLILEFFDTEYRLVVKDRGDGIDRRRLGLIRKIFQTDTVGTAETLQGLGLGLYLSKIIVRAHGGYLRAQSAPGWGTEISCHFPYETFS